ncbi:HPt (histidine-containing phosphotransfer) domain-containing protein [Okibacterium sp. HSC-33S16]|uniref:Hpt domain-containing protein n=1 Tax=Okibacterium sp. HSC-33S16 TaxID=2910965 RepID=UPI00209FF017|nr:Hpt domain-containing protein [Okibacterium sp. HSC-33S16]MCP2031447.1 HPt (histidine-containing phosphotransfer) domain-containing protein [Okibacterium sp. HSC-33S16]
MVRFPPNDLPDFLAGRLPLVDDTALLNLLESLDDDRDAVTGFVCAFVSQWPTRLVRIDERVTARDHDGALTAVLSLKVSSQMIGTSQLTSLACELEHMVRTGDFPAALGRVQTLRAVGAESLMALKARRP